MQSYKGMVITLGRLGALPRLTTTATPNTQLLDGSYRQGNIFQCNNISTSTPAEESASASGGGFFKSLFGQKVELQHAPHKEVRYKGK